MTDVFTWPLEPCVVFPTLIVSCLHLAFMLPLHSPPAMWTFLLTEIFLNSWLVPMAPLIHTKITCSKYIVHCFSEKLVVLLMSGSLAANACHIAAHKYLLNPWIPSIFCSYLTFIWTFQDIFISFWSCSNDNTVFRKLEKMFTIKMRKGYY